MTPSTSMTSIAIIADDLTGAADTGVLFVPVAGEMRLLAAHTFCEAPGNCRSSGVAVSADTRQMAEAEAVARVEALSFSLDACGAGLIYKKIDSCLRGHVGAELMAMVQSCGRKGALVAPAYPLLGRTTANDIHYVFGVPVAMSETGRDPVRPVTSSKLTDNLAKGHKEKVGHIPLSCVERGEDAVAENASKLLDEGCLIIGADATSEEHLDILARVALDRFPDMILSGSAGLARSLARNLVQRFDRHLPAQKTGRENEITALPGPMLFVGGSASSVLQGQLEHLARNRELPIHVLDAERVLHGLEPGQVALLCAEASRGDCILSLSPPVPGQKALPSRELALALGKLAADLLQRARPATIFASGGDTAQAILDVLGNPELLIRCEPAPGLIVSTLATGPHASLYFVTKSGGFGAPELLSDIHARLRQ